MTHVPRLLVVALLCASTAACRDPEIAKRKHVTKGDNFMAQGKPTEAALEYRNALRLDKRFGEARFKLAEAYSGSGNAQGAADEYVRAADLLPERLDVQLKAASVFLNAQQYEPALKYADKGLKADPKSVDAHLLRAYALSGQQDPDGALKELENTLLEAPADSRLYTSIGAMTASTGHPVEAEQSFRKAIEIDPKSIPARLALAYYFWSAKKSDEAERTINQAIALGQNDVAANRMLALFLLGQNRASDAETPLLRLVNAKDGAAAITLADLYAGTGRLERARPLYESLKTDDRARPVAVSRLAALEYSAGKHDRAFGILDAELKASPDNPQLLIMKAQWLAGEGKGNEALEVAKKATSVAPNSADAQYVLGLAFSVRGENETAMAAYKEALRLNPRLTGANVQLSRLLMLQGDPEQALQHATAASKANPRDPEARFSLAAALAARKDVSGAEAELKALQADFPASSRVSSLYGQVLEAKGDQPGATREFQRALRLDPTDVPALRAIVRPDVLLKKTDDARGKLKAALEKQPKRAALLILAAQAEHALGHVGPAEAYLRRAIDAEPTNREAYTQLALFYMEQKKLDQAKQQLREYAKHKPDSVPTLTMIGMIEETQGRQDAAVAVYEGIVKDGASAPTAANNLAYMYAERGVQLDMALQLAQAAKQQMPDNPDVSDTLGWVYVKKGMPDLAVPQLQFSVTKAPDNPGYVFHLGMAYAKAGRADQARVTLTRALQLAPGFSGAAEARAALASLGK